MSSQFGMIRISIYSVAVLACSAQAAELDFAREIRPVLSDACYHCHGPDAKARKAKLRLDDRAAALEALVNTK